MKSFVQFISEAKESQAVMQARRLGLTSDGHGGWYDRKGEFTAKTQGGKLQFYNQNQVVGKKDPTQIRTANNQQPVATQTAPSKEEKSKKDSKKTAEEKPKSDTITIVFGGFNPPTSEHRRLLSAAKGNAKRDDLRIYPSRSTDPEKSPLEPDVKIDFMKKMYPAFKDNIIDSKAVTTVFDALIQVYDDGYNNVTIMVGKDRFAEFNNLATSRNGKEYNFNELEVIPLGDKDPDSVASEYMRMAAAEGNYQEFAKGIGKLLKDDEIKQMYEMIRKKMKVQESYSLWKISPKLDYKNLRENYVNNKIFNIGDVVENLNTGMVGKIIRRGTNYLICLTDDDIMFKPWIYDVTEWTTVSGVPATHREVGTDRLVNYIKRLVGMKIGNSKKIINKNRKKLLIK